MGSPWVPKIIAVLSKSSGVGKSTIALNLAMALMSRGYAVLLVDSTAGDPAIAKLLGMEAPNLGFADLLDGRASPEEVTTQYKSTKLYLILGNTGGEVKFTYSKIARLLLNGIKLLSYAFIIADGPTPLLTRSFPMPYDALLVSSRGRVGELRTILELKLPLARQGVSVDLVINFTDSSKGDKDYLASNAAVTLPYENGMKRFAQNKIPAYLADRRSEFSKGIDQLADIYVDRRFRDIWQKS